jgi:hypothetical protein
VIITHRRDFDKDVEVLAKLCEGLLGPSSSTPNLQNLHHMLRKLIDIKGHSTFEMIVERLVSELHPCEIDFVWVGTYVVIDEAFFLCI